MARLAGFDFVMELAPEAFASLVNFHAVTPTNSAT